MTDELIAIACWIRLEYIALVYSHFSQVRSINALNVSSINTNSTVDMKFVFSKSIKIGLYTIVFYKICGYE